MTEHRQTDPQTTAGFEISRRSFLLGLGLTVIELAGCADPDADPNRGNYSSYGADIPLIPSGTPEQIASSQYNTARNRAVLNATTIGNAIAQSGSESARGVDWDSVGDKGAEQVVEVTYGSPAALRHRNNIARNGDDEAFHGSITLNRDSRELIASWHRGPAPQAADGDPTPPPPDNGVTYKFIMAPDNPSFGIFDSDQTDPTADEVMRALQHPAFLALVSITDHATRATLEAVNIRSVASGDERNFDTYPAFHEDYASLRLNNIVLPLTYEADRLLADSLEILPQPPATGRY